MWALVWEPFSGVDCELGSGYVEFELPERCQ